MKLTIAALALVALANAPAFAATVKGCEVTPIPGTNAFQKADPTCIFTDAAQDTGTGTPDAPGAFVLTADGIAKR